MGIHKLNQKKKKFFSDRIVVMSAAVIGAFSLLILQFYNIQIINHKKYEEDLRTSVQREVDTPAVRGNIYDCYGKPLAINKPVYVLKIDPEVTMDNDERNQVILKTIQLLEKNGDTYVDNMPISKNAPFTFKENEQAIHSFITNYVPHDDKEHKLKLYEYTADELMDYLRGEKVFDLDPSISDEDARKIIAIRLQMYPTTYQKYKKIIIASNISMKTLATIEEKQSEYPSVVAEIDSQRYYMYGKEFGNILGYTRTITASQYEELQNKGYDKDDIVGQTGIESSMENELRGIKGREKLEVDNVGITVSSTPLSKAIQGNDVYLTIDADLQLATYQAIEKRLSEAIVQRLRGGLRNLKPLTAREVIVSMAKNNQLNLNQMADEPQSTMQRQLYEKVKLSYEQELAALEEKEKNLAQEDKTQLSMKQHFANMLDENDSLISNRELMAAMGEAGTLPLDKDTIERIKQGGGPGLDTVLIQGLESGTIKPDQMAINPFSGSAVVVDIKTGQVLSVVGYPSYDSNEMIQHFNQYYTELHDGVDSRNLLWNRALRTAKAPGSTFKMLTALAGLEEGVITENTVINDNGPYTKTGGRPANCWFFTNHGFGHGNVNLERALEVSCNYYFYDVMYRIVTKYGGGAYKGIEAFSKYVKMFGLDQKTGIELEESEPNISSPSSVVHTQISRALNKLKNMDAQSAKSFKQNVKDYMETGFYPRTGDDQKSVEDRVEYLVQNDLRSELSQELNAVLGEDIDALVDRFLKDYKETFQEGVSSYADTLTPTILENKGNRSLKETTIEALQDLLGSKVQNSTKKAILKMIHKMPENRVQDIYLEVYTAALENNKEAVSQEVLDALEKRIADLKSGAVKADELLAQKIQERIIGTYLNQFFENVQMEWTNDINIRTGIGQGDNTFTPVQMARYIAGVANGKEVYHLKVVNGIYSNKTSQIYTETENRILNTLTFKDSYIAEVKKGMYEVTNGPEGTAADYFRDCEIKIAGKTGTAEEVNEHSWFVGFAPYDDPQIAIVTSMYDADGLGKYNTMLARDIFEAYFKIKNEEPKEKTDTTSRLVE